MYRNQWLIKFRVHFDSDNSKIILKINIFSWMKFVCHCSLVARWIHFFWIVFYFSFGVFVAVVVSVRTFFQPNETNSMLQGHGNLFELKLTNVTNLFDRQIPLCECVSLSLLLPVTIMMIQFNFTFNELIFQKLRHMTFQAFDIYE